MFGLLPWECMRRLLLSSLFIAFCSVQALSQSSALIYSIQQQMEAGNTEAIRELLPVLWRVDSTQVYQVAGAAEALFLGDSEAKTPTRPQADSLLRLSAIGRTQDQNDPANWRIRKALLAKRLPQYYSNQFRAWAYEALQAAPMEAPLYLYETWATAEAEAYQKMLVPVKSSALAWAAIDRALLLELCIQFSDLMNDVWLSVSG